jgi:hypothetical protein
MTHLTVAQDLFNELGWDAAQLPDVPVISCALRLPNGVVDIFCHYHAERDRLLFYVRPQKLAMIPAQRMAVAEYITRANYGLPLGNFELDLEDGELNFKNAVQVPEGVISTALLRPYLLNAVETVNYYLPGLQQVLAGSATPAAAVTALEGSAQGC